jgi:hypothetical protein
MLIDKLRKWRKERRRFPVLWLTYKQRVRHDVERAFKEDGGPSFFDEKYVGALTDAARKLESWELKLLLYQAAISAFVVLGLVTTDAAISLFGVSLRPQGNLGCSFRDTSGRALCRFPVETTQAHCD